MLFNFNINFFILGIVIIYHSKTKKEVISTFLCLTEIESANADFISKTIIAELKTYNLVLSNLLEIGTDNASAIVGKHQSVYVELKKLVPNLVLIKCVCHSIQLSVTRSWKKTMPKSLEFLVSETITGFLRATYGKKL